MNQSDYIVKDKEQEILIEQYGSKMIRQLMDELIAERKRQGLTQQEIADETGMKAPNITRIESKSYTPSLKVVMKYAAALGKTIEFKVSDK